MYLERVIQSNYFTRYGVKASPQQTEAFVQKFATDHHLQEKIDETPDADFMAALKAGAQVPKKRKNGKTKPPQDNKTN
jgi:hypothetical protein